MACLVRCPVSGVSYSFSFRLYGVYNEAELVAQCLVSVGHADLGHVGPSDVVPFRSIFQIIRS